MALEDIAALTLEEILEEYAYAGDFFLSLGINELDPRRTLKEFARLVNYDLLEDAGLNREQLIVNFRAFIERMETLKKGPENMPEAITIIGGYDKNGCPEEISLELKVGQVISIVGPTGSGKSRLLADIECLAQKDTPTKRLILLNGEIPDISRRFSMENKLVAQLSQNMNFVMDLSVQEFIRFHAESRMAVDIETTIKEIVTCANGLAGEKFDRSTPLTQLSGGQSRALMIADTALLSLSPIVLIDEIENAGIDRRNAVEILVKEEKLVLISTHDPVLALMGDKRLVIKNGGISKIINLSEEEKQYIDILEKIDKGMLNIRSHLRSGGIIDDKIISSLSG